MLPPAPTYSRALQRQLYIPSGSVWISEEALSQVLQRFCTVSKTRKRYGSFVPGPLESQRRLGKRRMTLQSDAIPTLGFSIPAWWGSLWAVDRTIWQWEPPATRNTRAEAAAEEEAQSALPRLRVGRGTASEALPDPTSGPRSDLRMQAMIQTFKEETRSFRNALKASSPEKIPALCDDFNRKLTQTLVLGNLAEYFFNYTIRYIFQDLRLVFSDSNEASCRCLALGQAMWNGISTSKVIQPSDFGRITMIRFVNVLCDIPMSEGLQDLARSIVGSVSNTQLSVMRTSIERLVHLWVISWQEEYAVVLPEWSLPVAIRRVSKATRAVERVSKATRAVERVSKAIRAVASVETLTLSQEKRLKFKKCLRIYQDARRKANEAIESSAVSIQKLQGQLKPHEHSIRTLAAALTYLPPGILSLVVQQCSRRIPKTLSVQHSWISCVAHLRILDETLLLETWRQHGVFLELDTATATEIMLNHWISQGLLERPAVTKILFDVTVLPLSNNHHGALLNFLDGERENCWGKARRLFKFLNQLGKHGTIYKTLLSLKQLRLDVPSDVMDETLEMMVIENPLLAHRLFRKFHQYTPGKAPLRLDKCPNFIFSLINNPTIRSDTIWECLGVPHYESTPAPSLANSMRPVLVDHFTRMATVFAQCNTRTHRAAFRNVVQCLFHLRLYEAAITPEFTRALVHVGISRRIFNDKWIIRNRADWLLEMVELVEGTDVALIVDEVAEAWNQSISAKVSRRNREINLLGVGPID